MKISGFITNLGKYNEGELVGEWIDFPISEEDLQAALQRIGIGSTDEFGQPYEEYFFTDWELPSGMDWEIFGEYPNIETVNEVAEAFEDIDYPEDVVSAVLEHYSTIEEGIEALKEGNFMFYSDVDTTQGLGEAVVEINGGLSTLDADTLREYFDYEAYGKTIETGSSIEYIDSGAIEFFD